MADPVTALVVEADLHHQLGAKRSPLQIAVGSPAAGGRGAALAALVFGQLIHQLARPFGAEG